VAVNVPPRSPSFGIALRRALRLRCPLCGISPVFISFRRVRSLDDWLHPLDGCPRCGYAYEREEGYFLLAIWGLNFGVVSVLSLSTAWLLDALFGLTVWQVILCVVPPMPLISVGLARHAKSLWLAIDHYFDPHVKANR